jgi:hypothetical protein
MRNPRSDSFAPSPAVRERVGEREAGITVFIIKGGIYCFAR